MPDSFLRKLGNNFIRDRLSGRRNVMQRNHEIIFGRTRRRDARQKLRGHSRCHSRKFSTRPRL